MAINSPAIIVSQYASTNRQMSLPNTEGIPQNTTWLQLLSPEWEPTKKVSHSPPPESAAALASMDDIIDIMDNYWDIIFEFTFPTTLDFYDVFAGELASTQQSLIVAEYGQQLWDILHSLQAMHIEPEHRPLLEKSVKMVERSLEDLRSWVEVQRDIQLGEVERAP